MDNNGDISKSEWIRSVLERYEGPLVRYAAHITGDLERARDVTQDTFLKLCEREPREQGSHLAEWLFTVCRNRALDVQRKENRMNTLAEDELDDVSSQEPPPDKVIELRESANAVIRLLATLPARQQEIVRLKFQNDLSYAEISRITNLSVSNVGFLLHTAIQTLRRKLTSQEARQHQPMTSYET